MVQESTNIFSDGLIKDLNPLTTPNTVLTDALNATLLTFNGNELVLQNDMGNTKIKGCKLTEGFIPIGMKENGGILYIISTNGEEMEIGSFPSPKPVIVNSTSFLTADIILNSTDSNNILNKNIQLSTTTLNPGDKFIVFLNINDLTVISSSINNTKKFYKLRLLSIENGVETELTNTLINQEKYISFDNFQESGYWFVPSSYPTEEVLNNYIVNNKTQVYKLRKSGKLYLRIELEDINDLKIKNTSNFFSKILDSTDTERFLSIYSNSFNDITLVGDGVKSISQLINEYNSSNVSKLYLKSPDIIPKLAQNIVFNKGNPNSIYPLLQFTNENNEFDNKFYLNFNIYLKALSDIKVDTIKIEYRIIDLLGINTDIVDFKIISFSDFIGDDYQFNNILIDIGNSCDAIVDYTITCSNNYYDINFRNFVIKDIIDLSIDPSQWANSQNSDYDFYDYDLFDYQTI